MAHETAIRWFVALMLGLMSLTAIAHAGDVLGIYEASDTWAKSLTSVGVPAAICGIAAVGAGIITHTVGVWPWAPAAPQRWAGR